MDKEIEDVDVLNEEIIVHPTATRKNGRWYVEFRVLADVVINGQKYEFETVKQIAVRKSKS